MSIEQILLLVILIGGSVLYATRRFAFEVTSILIITSLALTGILEPEKAFSGFASTATLTVAAMFVLSGGLIRTGALETVTVYLARFSDGRPERLMLLLAVVIPIASAFVNNTPVVVMMVPVILSLSRQFKISPSKLLIPVSYFSILGGTLTLFGTSTNILLDDLYRKAGGPGFGVFEFAPLGLIYSVVGGIFILLFSHRLLPNHSPSTDLRSDGQESTYISDITLPQQSTLIDRTVAQVFRRIAQDTQRFVVDPKRSARRRISNPSHIRATPQPMGSAVELLAIQRNGTNYAGGRSRELTLAVGDTLTISGTPNAIANFLTEVRSEAVTTVDENGSGNSVTRGIGRKGSNTREPVPQEKLVEAVILPDSPLNNRRIDDVQTGALFGAKILGIQRYGKPVANVVSGRRLESGDVLLLQAKQAALNSAGASARLLLIEGVDRSIVRADKKLVALLTMVGVIALASLTTIPIVVLALTGATLMIITQCLRVDEAMQSLDSSTLLLLAAAIPLGYAMDSTGLALLLVDLMLHQFGGATPVLFLSIFYLTTNLLAQVISAKAVAVLFAPIALSLAASMGVNPAAMIMAIAFGTAASFLTPMGHQVNAIVMGPGNYTFGDYIRIGFPMTILMWLIATFCIPLIWPL